MSFSKKINVSHFERRRGIIWSDTLNSEKYFHGELFSELFIIHLFQLISTLALVAAASAQYAPAPVAVVKEVPQPYAYEYGVADDYSKANFRKTETQDAAGNVGGSFTIALPDGRIQTTTYTADHTNGFVAEVTYSGEAVYPPAPAGGYPGEAHAAPAPGYAPGRK